MGKKKNKNSHIIIEGVTHSGEQFRPSDWAERISEGLSTFNLKNHRIYYSRLLHPTIQDGNKCVLLDKSLQESNPALYQHILDFARKNNLRICGEDDESSD